MKAQAVEYKEGSTTCEGWVHYDDSKPGKRPGVLLFTDWTGVGDYAKMRAKMIVEQFGYAVFAADIYGKGIRPQGPENCGPEMMKYLNNRPLLRARAKAGLEELKKVPVVDSSKIAAIGYCFGGITALELARTGADLAGLVGFHCNLNSTNPDEAKNIKARVLILNGAADPVVPDSETQAFIKEMKATNADWTLVLYGWGVVHSFTQKFVPTTGKEAAYNEKADRRSWAALTDFFQETLGKAG